MLQWLEGQQMIVRCIGGCHLFGRRYGDYKGEGIGEGGDIADLCRRVGHFGRKADRCIRFVRMNGKSLAQVDKCYGGSRWLDGFESQGRMLRIKIRRID